MKKLSLKLGVLFTGLFIIIFGSSLVVLGVLVDKQFKKLTKNELKQITDLSTKMTKVAATASINNYLRGIAEKGRHYAKDRYEAFEKGEISEKELWDELKTYFKSSSFTKIGETGYIAGVLGDGTLAIHPALEGVNISNAAFWPKVKSVMSIKGQSGYIEYDWDNKDGRGARPKAGWLSYFEPLNLIIWASSYREEFMYLVDKDNIRESVKSVRIGEHGYAYVFDIDGNVIIHPEDEGKNFFSHEDEKLSAIFKDMARLAQEEEGVIHEVAYSWYNTETGKHDSKIACYVYLPDFNWIVVSTAWGSEIMSPLIRLLMILVGLLIFGTVSFIIISALLSGRIAGPIARLSEQFESMKEGNLVQEVEPKYLKIGDEVGNLTRSFKEFSSNLRNAMTSVKQNINLSRNQSQSLSSSMTQGASAIEEMISTIKNVSDSVDGQMTQVERSANENKKLKNVVGTVLNKTQSVSIKTSELKQMINDQAAGVEQTASAIEEMVATINSVNNITEKAANSAHTLNTSAEQGRETMESTSENMRALLESIGTIHDFIGMIGNIASQTNLLAMNASIEAAHAGEHGRGFAVVAEEIRKLSEQSNQQAEEATKSLKEIEENVRAASEDLSQTEENFSKVLSESDNVSKIISEVRNATEEQTQGANEIIKSVEIISDVTEKVRTNYGDINDALSSIDSLVDDLNSSSQSTEETLSTLKEISSQIKHSMQEMTVGTDQLGTMINSILILTDKTSDGIKNLESQVSKYQTETEEDGGVNEQKKLLAPV